MACVHRHRAVEEAGGGGWDQGAEGARTEASHGGPWRRDEAWRLEGNSSSGAGTLLLGEEADQGAAARVLRRPTSAEEGGVDDEAEPLTARDRAAEEGGRSSLTRKKISSSTSAGSKTALVSSIEICRR